LNSKAKQGIKTNPKLLKVKPKTEITLPKTLKLKPTLPSRYLLYRCLNLYSKLFDPSSSISLDVDGGDGR